MSKICCFSGSRDLRGLNRSRILTELEAVLVNLIENEGYTDFRAGGAVGFDTLAAICVLKLREIYPQIKLHLVLPCKNQASSFSQENKRFYEAIIKKADSYYYLQEAYSDGVMFRRNRALVDGSDLCVALLTKSHGGTFQTVNYARKKKVEVKNITPLIK